MESSQQIEIWKNVVGFEGIYVVSSLGNVKRLDRNKNLKPGKAKAGYVTVSLNSKTYTVHQLVMRAFVGAPEQGKEINHINANRADNRLENLEYVTHSENMYHCVRMGRFNRPKGMCHVSSKLTDQDIREIRILGSSGVPHRKIASQFKVSHNIVGRIIRRQVWKHIP